MDEGLVVKFFKREEFKCRCCGEEHMGADFLEKIEKAREISGVPYVITSGWRCGKHNKEIGGKSKSEHIYGQGADIVADTSTIRFHIMRGLILAGFRRIGLGENFIHAGNSIILPGEVLWHYY
jgi:zinc D-Ala-D-Ala carboxypeptidase